MENTNWDTAQDAPQQNDWKNAEISADQNNEILSAEANRYETDEKADERLNFINSNPDPEDEEDEDEDEEDNDEDDAGDWGHVDPAESNSPFPDSNEPTAPGSAV